MEFYVNETTYPAVKSDGEEGIGYYTFANNSDYPIKVTFNNMAVEDNSGLNFVSDATASGRGSNDISLSLELPANVSANGFSSGVGNIKPRTECLVSLGTLNGKYIKDRSTVSSYGILQ